MSDWRDRIVRYDTRAEWLDARRKSIGSSDWASILGVDGAYRTKFEVWADKRGETPIDDAVPEYVEWGNILEPIVAEQFAKRVEKPVTRLDNALVTHPDFPWLSCSPDGWVGEQARAGYEGKVSNSYRRNEWYEGVPLLYEVQCQACMAVTGLTRWYIACLIGVSELVWKELEYDVDFVDTAFPILDRFWRENVEEGKAPTPSGGDRERRAIVSMWPQDNGEEIDLPHEHRYLVEKRIEAMKRLKEAEAVIEGVDAITRWAMGPSTRCAFQGLGHYVNKTSKSGVRTLRFYGEK